MKPTWVSASSSGSSPFWTTLQKKGKTFNKSLLFEVIKITELQFSEAQISEYETSSVVASDGTSYSQFSSQTLILRYVILIKQCSSPFTDMGLHSSTMQRAARHMSTWGNKRFMVNQPLMLRTTYWTNACRNHIIWTFHSRHFWIVKAGTWVTNNGKDGTNPVSIQVNLQWSLH